jgi:MSHA biogenesis protein MshN
MSLINKMLQDLERRRPEGNASPGMGGQVRAVPAPGHGGTRLAWWLVTILLVAVAALSWFAFRGRTELGVERPQPVLAPGQSLGPSLRIAPSTPGPIAAQARPSLPRADTGSAGNPVPAAEPARVAAEHVARVSPAGKPTLARSSAEPSASLSAEGKPVEKTSPVAFAEEHTSGHTESVKAIPAQEPAATGTPSSVINKQMRELTPQQRAENEYRHAVALIQQGRVNEAIGTLASALQFNPHHAAARQTLVGLLIEAKRSGEAEPLLQEGLNVDPAQTGFAMILARLQVGRGETQAALDTLGRSLPYAGDKPDYHAFLAALLQREGKHRDAVEHYLVALRNAPQSGIWLMGLGISLQAENHDGEAKDAYERALATRALTPELQAFVAQRLKQLQQ